MNFRRQLRPEIAQARCGSTRNTNILRTRLIRNHTVICPLAATFLYPAVNVATPIYFANEVQQGVLLTAQEETARASAPMLIILLGPEVR
jgi:hypothetical protein